MRDVVVERVHAALVEVVRKLGFLALRPEDVVHRVVEQVQIVGGVVVGRTEGAFEVAGGMREVRPRRVNRCKQAGPGAQESIQLHRALAVGVVAVADREGVVRETVAVELAELVADVGEYARVRTVSPDLGDGLLVGPVTGGGHEAHEALFIHAREQGLVVPRVGGVHEDAVVARTPQRVEASGLHDTTHVRRVRCAQSEDLAVEPEARAADLEGPEAEAPAALVHQLALRHEPDARGEQVRGFRRPGREAGAGAGEGGRAALDGLARATDYAAILCQDVQDELASPRGRPRLDYQLEGAVQPTGVLDPYVVDGRRPAMMFQVDIAGDPDAVAHRDAGVNDLVQQHIQPVGLAVDDAVCHVEGGPGAVGLPDRFTVEVDGGLASHVLEG